LAFPIFDPGRIVEANCSGTPREGTLPNPRNRMKLSRFNVDNLIHIWEIETVTPCHPEFAMETASMIACGIVLFVGIYGLTGMIAGRK